jgi:multimeric flavodoxin WrbA
MKSLLERLVFQYLVYDKDRSSLFKHKIKAGLIYTMGAPESMIKDAGYEKLFQTTERIMKHIFGSAESLVVCDTYQFDDYSKYESSAFNPEEKTKRKQEIFPVDCKNAFDLGVRFANNLQ